MVELENTGLDSEKERIASSITEAIGPNEQNIKFDKIESFLGGNNFVFFRTAESFGKYTEANDTEDRREKLKRESGANLVLKEMGLPSLRVDVPYKEVGEKGALTAFEKLSAEEGVIFSSPEEIAGIEPEKLAEYAKASIDAILALSQQPLPETELTASFIREKPQYKTPESAVGHFQLTKDILNNPKFAPLLDQIIGPTTYSSLGSELEINGSHLLNSLMDECSANIQLLGESWSDDKEYFIHGDAEPKNIYLQETPDGYNGIPIDYEYAGATHHPGLAMIYDLSNFYCRLWSSPDYQREFACALYDSLSAHADPELAKSITRTVAIAGATNLNKHPFSKVTTEEQLGEEGFSELREARFAYSLLGNLPDVLGEVEERFVTDS